MKGGTLFTWSYRKDFSQYDRTVESFPFSYEGTIEEYVLSFWVEKSSAWMKESDISKTIERVGDVIREILQINGIIYFSYYSENVQKSAEIARTELESFLILIS